MKIQNRYLIIFAVLFPFPLPCNYPEGKHPEILIICSPCQHKPKLRCRRQSRTSSVIWVYPDVANL